MVFEDSIKHSGFQGSADLFIDSSFGMGIFDFKRSSAGVPTKKEFLEFEKIQLWFYLKNLSY